MSVKRRFSTRWGHPYHLQGACTECRQTLLHPLCSITPMTLESYTEYSAQSKREDTTEGSHTAGEAQEVRGRRPICHRRPPWVVEKHRWRHAVAICALHTTAPHQVLWLLCSMNGMPHSVERVERASRTKDGDRMTPSSLSRGMCLLGFRGGKSRQVVHLDTDRDRGRRINRATAIPKDGRLHAPHSARRPLRGCAGGLPARLTRLTARFTGLRFVDV